MMPGENNSRLVRIAADAVGNVTCQNCTVLHEALNGYVNDFLLLKQKIIDSAKSLIDYQDKYNDAHLQSAQRETSRFHDELAELQAKMVPLEKQSAECELIRAELMEKRSRLKAQQHISEELERLKEESIKTIALKKRLEEQLKEMEDTTEKQKLENAHLKIEKAVLENDLLKAQASLRTSQEVSDRAEWLREEHASTSLTVKKLEGQLRLFEESNRNQSHQISQLTRKKSILQGNLQDLQDRLTHFERERIKEYRSTSTQATAHMEPNVNKGQIRKLLEDLWRCVEPSGISETLNFQVASHNPLSPPSPGSRGQVPRGAWEKSQSSALILQEANPYSSSATSTSLSFIPPTRLSPVRSVPTQGAPLLSTPAAPSPRGHGLPPSAAPGTQPDAARRSDPWPPTRKQRSEEDSRESDSAPESRKGRRSQGGQEGSGPLREGVEVLKILDWFKPLPPCLSPLFNTAPQPESGEASSEQTDNERQQAPPPGDPASTPTVPPLTCRPGPCSPPSAAQHTVDPPGKRASTVDPPRKTASTVEPPAMTASTVDPSGMTASTVEPPGWTASTVEPPEKTASTVEPPEKTASTLGPPGTTASTVGPPGRTASTVGPPGRTASTVGPPGRTASTVEPPGRTASTVGPPGRTVSTVEPPGRTASATEPPGWTASTVEPPGWTASTVEPPGWTASTVGPPGRTASTVEPPGRTASAMAPPDPADHQENPPGGSSVLEETFVLDDWLVPVFASPTSEPREEPGVDDPSSPPPLSLAPPVGLAVSESTPRQLLPSQPVEDVTTLAGHVEMAEEEEDLGDPGQTDVPSLSHEVSHVSLDHVVTEHGKHTPGDGSAGSNPDTLVEPLPSRDPSVASRVANGDTTGSEATLGVQEGRQDEGSNGLGEEGEAAVGTVGVVDADSGPRLDQHQGSALVSDPVRDREEERTASEEDDDDGSGVEPSGKPSASLGVKPSSCAVDSGVESGGKKRVCLPSSPPSSSPTDTQDRSLPEGEREQASDGDATINGERLSEEVDPNDAAVEPTRSSARKQRPALRRRRTPVCFSHVAEPGHATSFSKPGTDPEASSQDDDPLSSPAAVKRDASPSVSVKGGRTAKRKPKRAAGCSEAAPETLGPAEGAGEASVTSPLAGTPAQATASPRHPEVIRKVRSEMGPPLPPLLLPLSATPPKAGRPAQGVGKLSLRSSVDGADSSKRVAQVPSRTAPSVGQAQCCLFPNAEPPRATEPQADALVDETILETASVSSLSPPPLEIVLAPPVGQGSTSPVPALGGNAKKREGEGSLNSEGDTDVEAPSSRSSRRKVVTKRGKEAPGDGSAGPNVDTVAEPQPSGGPPLASHGANGHATGHPGTPPPPDRGVPSSPLLFWSATPKHAVPVPGRLPSSALNPSPAHPSSPSQENSMRILDTMYPKMSARARTLSILRGNVNLAMSATPRASSPSSAAAGQRSGFKSLNSSTTAFTETQQRGKRTGPAVILPKSAKRLRLDTQSPGPAARSAVPASPNHPGPEEEPDLFQPAESPPRPVAEQPLVGQALIDHWLGRVCDRCFDLLPVIQSHLFVGNRSRKPVLRDEEKEAISEFCTSNQAMADDMVSAILAKLKAGRTALSDTELQALCRVYTGICRHRRDWERAHILAYSLLKEDFPHASKLILFMVTTWHDVISHGSPVCRAVHAVTKLRAEGEVLRCLASYLNWDKNPPADIDELIPETVSAIRSGNELSFQKHDRYGVTLSHKSWEIIHSLDLLCAHKKWNWTHDNVLGHDLWPLMNSWVTQPRAQQTPIPDVSVAATLRLVGLLGQLGVQEKCLSSVKTIATVINTFCRHGQSEGVPWEVQLAAVYAIYDLSPSNPKESMEALAGWRAETTHKVPPCVTSYITQIASLCRQINAAGT